MLLTVVTLRRENIERQRYKKKKKNKKVQHTFAQCWLIFPCLLLEPITKKTLGIIYNIHTINVYVSFTQIPSKKFQFIKSILIWKTKPEIAFKYREMTHNITHYTDQHFYVYLYWLSKFLKSNKCKMYPHWSMSLTNWFDSFNRGLEFFYSFYK